MEKQITQQVTIYVPRLAHNALKAEARRRGISERALYQQLLQPGLDHIVRHQQQGPEEAA